MEDRAHYVSFDIYVILLWISRRFCRSSIKPILTGVISKLTNNIKENLVHTNTSMLTNINTATTRAAAVL